MYYRLITAIEKELAAHAEMLATLRTLPEMEGINQMQTFQPGHIILCMPYDLEMFHRNRAILEAAGFKWNGDLSVATGCGNVITKFDRGSLRINFHIDPDFTGSTCKKVLIGYVQAPIYEVTCMDAEPLIEAVP
jgi:hypothetical protein